jgi:hypothetical protein
MADHTIVGTSVVLLMWRSPCDGGTGFDVNELLEAGPVASVARQAVVRVRLLPEPSLWRWDIVDADGRLVASSWADEWVAFAAREEAAAAGACRLAELMGPARQRSR